MIDEAPRQALQNVGPLFHFAQKNTTPIRADPPPIEPPHHPPPSKTVKVYPLCATLCLHKAVLVYPHNMLIPEHIIPKGTAFFHTTGEKSGLVVTVSVGANTGACSTPWATVPRRDQGHYTIAQDETSSAVYGMPKAAAALGAAVDILPVERVASKLVDAFFRQRLGGGRALVIAESKNTESGTGLASKEYAVMVLLVDIRPAPGVRPWSGHRHAGRRAGQPQAGGAPHALGGIGRDQSTQRVQDDRAKSRCTASIRSGAAVFHGRAARPAVGGGHHLRSHPAGFLFLSRRSACPMPPSNTRWNGVPPQLAHPRP
jgi:CheB methylesterase